MEVLLHLLFHLLAAILTSLFGDVAGILILLASIPSIIFLALLIRPFTPPSPGNDENPLHSPELGDLARTIDDPFVWVVRTGYRRHAIEKSTIVAVEAWAAKSWMRHEVRLHVATKTDVRVLTVARKWEARVLFDFYDGLDFFSDSYWALELGSTLAHRLGLLLTRSGELK